VNKFNFLVAISLLISETLITTLAWSHEPGSCVNIAVGDKPAWAGRPFDLIYDGNWVVEKGSVAKLNRNDELFVVGGNGYKDNNMHGLRFSTGSDWEKFASGAMVKVTIEAKSSTASNILYKVAYVTNEVGFSGWREAVAGKEYSSFSFDYRVGEMKNGLNDFVMVFPNSPSSEEGILIRKAILEVKP